MNLAKTSIRIGDLHEMEGTMGLFDKILF